MPDKADTLDQPARLAAIAASDLLDTDAIPALDRVVAIAARLLGVPVAQLNVVTADRQIPVSHVGGAAWGRSVALDRSYCQHVIRSGAPLVVEDARAHPLVAASPATRESGIVAYLSVPILSPRAPDPLASLCVVDFEPRAWSAQDVATLTDVAAWALSEIELRAGQRRDRLRAEEAARTSEARLRAVYDGTYEYIGLLSPDGKVLDCNRASLEFAGNTRAEVVGMDFWETPWFRYTPGAPEKLRAAIARAAAGEFIRYEATLQRPAAEPLTFDFSLHPVRNGNGDVIYIVPEGRDITDRQRVEAARRASEERYRTLFESIDEGFCVIEVLFEDGRPSDYLFREANPAFVAHTGLVDAVGRRIRELAPTHEAYWFERYGHVARTGESVRFEADARALGRSYDVFAFRLGADGENRVAVLFRDISAQKAAAVERDQLLAALEVERARLVEVIRRAPAFMVVLRGPEHVVERVNDAYQQLIGHRDVVLGKPLFEAVPEARGQGFEALLDEVLATGRSFVGHGLPLKLRRTPGAPPEERIIDLAYVPLTEVDGTRSGIVALGTDVTEPVRARREAERARDRAERLQALTAALAQARTLDDVADVVVADMVVALGARTGALAGRASDDDAMLLLRTIGFPESVAASVRRQPLDLRSPLTECFRTRAPVWVETREGPQGLDARYPPIAPVWDALGVRSAAFVPLITAGETVGVISFGFDQPRGFDAEERSFLLTLGQQAALAVERARLFEAERAARAEAERANRAKSEFLAVMSHELRTPLNAIAGYVELMDMGIRGPVTQQQRDDLRRVQTSQRHLMGLINEVLNFAKLETGSVNFELADVPLRDLVTAAEALIAPQAAARGHELTVTSCAPELAARADAEKTRQILVNLLANAVKFTDRGGRIGVVCAAAGERVTVSVSDTGIGIPPEQLARIFEPFVQVRADLTRTAEGTGLGLAISRDLARAMGGDLTAESTPGAGSRFILWLPRAESH